MFAQLYFLLELPIWSALVVWFGVCFVTSMSICGNYSSNNVYTCLMLDCLFY